MRKYFDISKFLLLVVLTIFLFAFSAKRNNARNLKDVVINFDNAAYFLIAPATVNKLLIQNADSVTSIRKETLDLRVMERLLDSNPMIEKSEVFITVDGVLGVNIKQRNPIARVVGETSFYVDDKGKTMPVSKEFTPRVPLISGFSETNFEELTPLLLKIKNDEFMQKHVVGIHQNKRKEVLLFFRKYDFKVLLGKPENIDKKFQNFKAFYQKTRQDSTIYFYEAVNLKFDSQVVATKKE